MSDFLDADARFWKSVDLFRRSRFDVMLFQIVHPEELELPARRLRPVSGNRRQRIFQRRTRRGPDALPPPFRHVSF